MASSKHKVHFPGESESYDRTNTRVREGARLGESWNQVEPEAVILTQAFRDETSPEAADEEKNCRTSID